MDRQRRDVLKAGGGLGLAGVLVALGVISPEAVLAAGSRAIFEATSLDAVFAALGTGRPPDSADIMLTAPDVAENGAMVSIGVASRLPATERIVILVERNPSVVAASFSVPPGTLPDIQTRVKMAESSPVHALVRAGGKFHMAHRDVRVTVGGCAG